MKIQSLLFAAAVVAVSSVTAKADYQINFSTANGGTSNPVFDVDGTTKLNNTFFGQLYTGANASSLVAIGSIVAFGTVGGNPVSGAEGFIINDTISVTSSSLFGGSSGVYQLRAWQGASTYELAQTTVGAKIGSSSVQTVTFGGVPSGGGAPLTPPDASLHGSFALTVVVPEPATIALGLFGAAGLFIRRRK